MNREGRGMNPVAGVAAAPSGLRLWWIAARPRTLALSVTPVILGTALAWSEGAPHGWVAALVALVCAVMIQVGTNLHNDVADFERGNDRPGRVGPVRVTAAGWATPQAVKNAVLWAFGCAFLLGAYLVFVGGAAILTMGCCSLAAGWAYSGGSRPISHSPYGELVVWLFFGVVAVVGSHWLQSGHFALSAFLGGAAVGLPAAAVLLVNNWRDRDEDIKAGRNTLAALLGAAGTPKAYGFMILLPFISLPVLAYMAHPGVLLALAVFPFALVLARRLGDSQGADLNRVLASTARFTFLFGAMVAVGASL